MDKKNLMPQQAQPIERIPTGQLPLELSELSEEQLCDGKSNTGVIPLASFCPCPVAGNIMCSYDGNDAE